MHQSYYDIDYKMTNRERKLNPKGDKSSWCICDIWKVSDGEKCSNCHRRHSKYRFKI